MAQDFNLRSLACALLALIVCVSGCAVAPLKDPPRVTLVNLKPLDVQLLEQRFLVTLRIQNPSESALAVNGMDYEIMLNDQRFATGVNNESFSVPAFSEHTIDVTVSSTILRIFEQILELERSETKTLNYGITGGMSIQGAFSKVPFSYQEELDLSNIVAPAKPRSI